MREPQILWATLLAIVPWLLYFKKHRSSKRVSLPSFFSLLPNKSRLRRSRERLIQTFLRSLSILFIVLLWSFSKPIHFLQTDVRHSSELSSASDKQQKIPPTVLIFDGSDSISTSRDIRTEISPAQYLAWAIDPKEKSGRVEVRFSTELCSTLKDQSFEADVLILADVVSLNEDEIKSLDTFLSKDKRALIIWSGQQTDCHKWNTIWQKHNLALQTIKIDVNKYKRRPFKETPLEKIFRATIPSFEDSGLNQPPIEVVIPTVGNDAAPILRDQKSGTSLFVRIAPKVYWIAASLEPHNRAFTLTPSFPTFVNCVVCFAQNESISNMTEMNGEELKKRARADNICQALWLALALVFSVDLYLQARERRENARYSTS